MIPWTVARQAPLYLGILQARILEWVARSFSWGSSQTRDQTHISCIGKWILYHWATREAKTWIQVVSLEYSLRKYQCKGWEGRQKRQGSQFRVHGQTSYFCRQLAQSHWKPLETDMKYVLELPHSRVRELVFISSVSSTSDLLPEV